MPYKYSKIYNVSQGVWARDVSGEDDSEKVWEDNEWTTGDALLGFYSENGCTCYTEIYCEDGYAVYIQINSTKDKDEFMFHDVNHRIPPAILINLNDAYDTEFIHYKSYETVIEDEEEKSVTTYISKNQKVIDFLERCSSNTNNKYKKMAYTNAINQLSALWREISENDIENLSVGPSIKNKILKHLKEI